MDALTFKVQIYVSDTSPGTTVDITEFVTFFELERIGKTDADIPGNENWTARLEAYGIADYSKTACFFWTEGGGATIRYFIRSWVVDPNTGVTAANVYRASGLEDKQFTDVLTRGRPLTGRLKETCPTPRFVEFRGPDRSDVIDSNRGYAWGSGWTPRVNQGYIANTLAEAQNVVKADTLDRAEVVIDNTELYAKEIQDEDPHTDVVVMTQRIIDAAPNYTYSTPTAGTPTSTERVMEEIGTGDACVVVQKSDGTWCAQWSDGFIDEVSTGGGGTTGNNYLNAIGIWRRMYIKMSNGGSLVTVVRRDTGEQVASATAPFTYLKSDLTIAMETIVDTYPGPTGLTADRAFYKLWTQRGGCCGIWLTNTDGTISIAFCSIETTAQDLVARQIKNRIRLFSRTSGTTSPVIQGYSAGWGQAAMYDTNSAGSKRLAATLSLSGYTFLKIVDMIPRYSGYNTGQPTNQINYDYLWIYAQGSTQNWYGLYTLTQMPNSSFVSSSGSMVWTNVWIMKFIAAEECERVEGKFNTASPGSGNYDYECTHIKFRRAGSTGVYDRYSPANTSGTVNNIIKPIAALPTYSEGTVTRIFGNYVNVFLGPDGSNQRTDIWFGESFIKVPTQRMQDRTPVSTRNVIEAVMPGIVQSSRYSSKIKPFLQTTTITLPELYKNYLEPPYDPRPINMSQLEQLNIADLVVPTAGVENAGSVRRIRARFVPVQEYELEIFTAP